MITVLNYCSQDRDSALRLLRWIGELGGVSKHDLVLQCSQQVLRDFAHEELIEVAKPHWNSVEHFAPFTEEERGWPWSPNHGWREALIHMREKYAKIPKEANMCQGWFWVEPDAVPLSPKWADQFEADYREKKKPFWGAEITRPRHRMSGVGFYPAMTVAFLRHKRLGDLHVRNEAFDAYFASEIIPNAHFTPLLQDVNLVSRNPDLIPTFPDEDSLSLLSSQALMFHRCKDGTLIDRLRERRALLEPKVEPAPAPVVRQPVYTSPPVAEPVMDDEKEQLRAKIKEMEAMLSTKVKDVQPRKGKWGKRKKRERTLEQIAKDKERMARARAGRANKVEV